MEVISTPHGPRHRLGHRRARRGSDLPRPERRAPRPARSLANRAPAGPQGRDQQARRAAHAPPRIHHRRPRRRRSAARCPRSSQPRRSADHDALRPRPRVPRPSRDLRGCRLPCRCRPLTSRCVRRSADLQVAAERLAHHLRGGHVVRRGALVESSRARASSETTRPEPSPWRAPRSPAELRTVEVFLASASAAVRLRTSSVSSTPALERACDSDIAVSFTADKRLVLGARAHGVDHDLRAVLAHR